jgi:4-amino-4-deoxy-L-arabinose transferase-like glycosyltransferase
MFWTFAVLGLALLVRSGNPRWWLLIGLCSGLGVSAKLTDLFLGPGLLLLLLVRADLRKWLATPWPWAGGAIAAAVVAPLLVWNEAHQWVTFTKQFGRLSVAELQPIHLPEFIGTQFGLLNPLLAILAGVAAAVAFRHRASDRGRAIGSLLIVTTPLLAYMTFHSIHGQVQGQWLAPLYPTLALAAAAGAEVRERWNQIAAAVLPTGVVATVVGFAAAINPTALIPPWLDVGNASRGWNDVASAAEALRASNGAAWIALTRYEPHAAVAYELRNRDVPVVAINERARYAFAPLPDRALLDQPALLLTTSPPSRFSGCFASLTAIQTVARRSGEATVETYTAYLVTGASPDLFSRGCDGIRKRESDNALRPG